VSDEPASPFRPSTPTSTSNIPSFDPVAPPPTPVQPVARAARSSRGGAALNGLIVVAALVAVGGIAFGVGRATASSSTGAGTGQGQLANGNRGTFPRGSFAPGGSFPAGGNNPGGGFGGGGGITLQGTVVSVNAGTLTLKTANGQTVEIPLASSTTYGTETAGDASAVTQGAEVRVQLQGGRGAFGGGGGNGGQGPGASPAPGSSAAPGVGRGFTLGSAQSVTVLP